MRYLLLPLLAFFLVSCQTVKVDDIQKDEVDASVKNGCVIDAADYQCALEANQSIHPLLWSHILIVEFTYDNKILRHAYCVFQTLDGTMWAYDRNGSLRLRNLTKDPTAIANQLMWNVRKAWWDNFDGTKSSRLGE
jgi:hypothetical protein